MNCYQNFGFVHKAGIVMPVSSLPSQYGIGSFGKAAFDFVDFLDATGQTCWQVLPLNPTSYGDSPYQSPASVAGNPYFIDLDILVDKGLLTAAEAKASRKDGDRVDYGWLFNTRYEVLRLAYARFVPDKAYARFVAKNTWLTDYSLFMALKVQYNYAPWTTWDKEHREYDLAMAARREFEEEMAFWQWVQFEFYTQWERLVQYAHSKRIRIIGDMPIYVAHDSMDVWAAREQFLLDEEYNPTEVAGCPPDGFSPDGQLWGNPIYDWKLMEKQGFQWWIRRIGHALRIYDILRIDHFRGFAGYYTIPYGDDTARNGHWEAAPGVALFRAMKEVYPKAKIIVEDLGFITDDVRELLWDTGFPGMKMLHFAFYDPDHEYLPRCFESPNCVAYASSHDSDCTRSWIAGLSGEAKKRFDRECPRTKGQSRTYDLIQLTMGSKANLAVVPMQDYLNLTNEQGRMNVPSTAQGNWSWRINPRYNTAALRARVLCMAVKTKRAK